MTNTNFAEAAQPTTAKQVIEAKEAQFRAQLLGGKLVWAPDEIRSYFLVERARGVSKDKNPDTLPWILDTEHNLGPVAGPKLSGIIRGAVALAGYKVELRQGLYYFTPPEGTAGVIVLEKIVEVPVEKIVERVVTKTVEKQADQEEVVFPSTPALALGNPNYVTPPWFKRVEAALNAGKHVAIAGPPGGGKSTAAEQYFVGREQPFVTINGDAGFRRRDMEGSTEISQGTTFFRVAEFAAAAVNGWGCILNEVNAADPDALMWINGLLEVPFVVNIHGKMYPVHKDFKLIVTYNPGLVGTKTLPQAFKDRFFPVKLGFPALAFIKKMLVAKGMNPNAEYSSRLLKYAGDAWALHERGSLRYQISPRRLFDVVFLMDSGTCTDLNDAIKMAVVDAVDSAADAQMLLKLITAPLRDIETVSQFA